MFIGAPTKAFANNRVLSYDPNSPANADSQQKQFEGLELDQWNWVHHDYEASFYGITIGYEPFGVATDGHHVAPTADRYDIFLAGPMPTMLKTDGGSDSNLIRRPKPAAPQRTITGGFWGKRECAAGIDERH